jgi:arylsulfatase A-like enzyme
VAQLKAYDEAFGEFFVRLKADGIDQNNTLFIFTADEGDHFAGALQPLRTATASTFPASIPKSAKRM